MVTNKYIFENFLIRTFSNIIYIVFNCKFDPVDRIVWYDQFVYTENVLYYYYMIFLVYWNYLCEIQA